VVNNIFLEAIVTSCWLMDVSLFWSETPTAPTHPTPPVSSAAPVVTQRRILAQADENWQFFGACQQ